MPTPTSSGSCCTSPPRRCDGRWGRGAARAASLPDLGLQMPLGAGLLVLAEIEASIAVVDEAARRRRGETRVAVRLLAASETDARPSSEAARTWSSASCPAAPSQATRKGGSHAHPEGHRAHARMCASGQDRSRQNQCHFTQAWVRARNGAPASEISHRRRRGTALPQAAQRLHVAQPAASERCANSSRSSGSKLFDRSQRALSSPSRGAAHARRLRAARRRRPHDRALAPTHRRSRERRLGAVITSLPAPTTGHRGDTLGEQRAVAVLPAIHPHAVTSAIAMERLAPDRLVVLPREANPVSLRSRQARPRSAPRC
jgi:hypothetical protein